MDKQIKNALVIFLYVGVAFLACAVLFELKSLKTAGTAPLSPGTIIVSGHGELFVSPDIATFSYSITTDGATVKEAQDSVTSKANAVLAYLKKNSIDDKDIKTTNYSIQPKYEYSQGVCTNIACPPSKQTLVGYTVEQDTQVKVRDAATAGTIIGGMGSLDVQNLSGLQFTVDDPEVSQNQARGLAVADAKQQAEVLAKELGVHLGAVLYFTDNANNNGLPPSLANFGMAKADIAPAAPTLPTGQNKVTSDVSVTYEIQ